MSDEFNEFGGEEATKKSDGGGLRKFAEEQKARAEALEKELAELRKWRTEQSVKAIFDELKVPEKVRKFYSGEAEADKVKAWVEENADVFNLGDVKPQEQQDLAQVAQVASLGQDLQSVSLEGFKQKAAELKNSGARNGEAALNELLSQFLPKGSHAPPQV